MHLEVGQGHPTPTTLPSGVQEIRIHGQVVDEQLKQFLRSARQSGIVLQGMDKDAVSFIHDDTTQDSNRG